MKIIYTTLLITIIAISSLQAQRVEIDKKKNRIGEENIVGLVSKIVGEEDDIEGKWYRALRTLGRMREEGNYLTVKEATFEGWGEDVVPLYSKLMAADSITEVWITVKSLELSEDSLQLANEKLEQFLYDFSLNYYQDAAQKKIDEAERAVAFTVKKHQKLQAEEKELKKDSVDNSDEIERLKQLLEKNDLEAKVIVQKIIDNKADQDTTLVDIERLKKIVEQKKEVKAAIE